MNPIRGVIRKLKALGWYPFYNGFYEHLRTDKKIILLESRGGNALEGNILRIAMELSDRRYKEYRVIIAVKNSARQTVKEKKEYYENHPLVVNYLYLQNEVNEILQTINQQINNALK